MIGQNIILGFEEQGYENSRVQYLYLGQSNDIARRLNECFQESKEDQKIVKYIRQEDKKKRGNTLKVKWIEEPNHQLLEGK